MGVAERERPEVLVVADSAAWRQWLDVHEAASDGVWLLLAKRGTTSPRSTRSGLASPTTSKTLLILSSH